MQQDPLRKVAILVASLDEAWSERVLDGLPALDAKRVRQQVEKLEEVDPDEQQTIIAEFRRSLAQPRSSSSDGVEIEASLLKRIDHQDYTQEAPRRTGVLEFISTADADCLVEMLSSESTQTIALVISRLETDRAAEVLNKFPMDQQAEILNRLEQLDDADEHAVAIIEAQINQGIASLRQRRERMAAGKQMVERLISHTTASNSDIIVADKLPKPTTSIATEYGRTSVNVSRKTLPTSVRYERMPLAVQDPAPKNPFAHLTANESQLHLEKLPDAVLFSALSRVDSQVVSLALVGASEKLMKRVLRGLSRREGNQFRQQLRDSGPTRLSDILAAQQEVLYTAAQLN